jgi:energy-coupling factor transport system substrate-specific component
MNTNKLKAKDLITIAIFSVVFLVIFMIFGMGIGIVVWLYPFCVAVEMIPCGIVWAYIRVKAPKPLAVLIQGVIFAVIAFVMGSGWPVAAGVLAGAIFAELLARAGGYKSFKWNAAGYAVFAVCLNLGIFAIMLIARDYYFDFSIESGMTKEYMTALLDLVSGPLLLLTSAMSAVGAVLGMLLGRTFLKKHFQKAGII